MTDELSSDPELDPSSEPPTIVSTGAGSEGRARVDGPGVPRSAVGHEPPTSKKPRSKMTLRIPDDEVSRPSGLADTTVSAPPPSTALPPVSAPPVSIGRIVNVATPTKQMRVTPAARAAEPREQVLRLPSAPNVILDEDSWTPYQPTAIELDVPPPPDSVDIPIDSSPDPESPRRAATPAPPAPFAASRKLPPVAAPPLSSASPPVEAALQKLSAALAAAPVEGSSSPARTSPSSPPPPARGAAAPDTAESESFPEIVFEEPPVSVVRAGGASGETGHAGPRAREHPADPTVVDANERIGSSPPPPLQALPPARARAQATVDPDEIAIEAAESDPAAASEPPEISPEDVVSVEPVLDKTRSASAPPPPMRLRAPSNPNFSPSVAPAAPNRPSTPKVPTTTIRTMVVLAEHAVTAVPQPPVSAPPPPPPPRPPPLVIVPGVSPLAPPPMSDSAASTRKRVRPWWEELFNDDFIRTMARITDRQVAKEVDFIEESLGLAKGAMVLDLACGTGRHAIELTQRGYQVVGFDLSLAMLAKAADEAQDRQQKLNFVQGDMREMTFDGTFDGVYSWATSFGFFEEEKNAAVIANIRRALKPGGQLLLDVVNRDFVAQQNPSMVWFEGDGCVCMDDMSIDWITSRMRVKRTMMMDDGRSREIEYSIRIYSLHELGRLLHDNGFGVAQVSGRVTTPGTFLGADSPRTLILAEKK